MMSLFVEVVICGGNEANNNFQNAWIEHIRIHKRFPCETDFMLDVATFSVVFSLCAQNWTPQDSLQLQKLLQQEGELELNSNMLKELKKNVFNSEPIMSNKKSWMEFDESLPFISKKTEKKLD